jgi:hypothetical protein
VFSPFFRHIALEILETLGPSPLLVQLTWDLDSSRAGSWIIRLASLLLASLLLASLLLAATIPRFASPSPI